VRKLARVTDLILEIVEGPFAGRQITLTQVLVIGRDPSAGLVLDDTLVSRQHLRVTPEGGGAVAEDLGSLNGSIVNGNELQAQSSVRVDPGDRLQVGLSVLLLRTPAEVARVPSAVHPIPPALATPARPPDFIPPEIATPGKRGVAELEEYLDIHTKGKAKTAPLAVFVLVVFAVLIFLATR